jgi:hypothetical protein
MTNAVLLMVILARAAFAEDPILADLNKAKLAHGKELARLREKLIADIDAVIKAENDRGAGIDFLLKERKGFVDNGVLPLLPKLLPASRQYVDGKKTADTALEAEYLVAISGLNKKKRTADSKRLSAELKELEGESPPASPTVPPKNEEPSKNEGPPKKDKADGKTDPNIVALLRFYDTRLSEHVYTYGEGEPAAWRKDSTKTRETIVGYASLKELPDTRRLYRAIRKDGMHYFYFEAPRNATGIRLEDFVLYVWTKPDDGRVPIHGACLPDRLDMYFDADESKVKKVIEDTSTGLGAKRVRYPNAFYLYAKPK